MNLISKKEGLQTFIEGKPNAIASLMIGILSTLSEFELSRIKERSKEGIAEAKKRDAYANNGGNKRIESIEEFMNKESSKKVVKQLKKGFSVRDCAGICGCSVSLVMKVKKLVEDSASAIPLKSANLFVNSQKSKPIERKTTLHKSAPLSIIDNEPKETKAKKKEIALQVYAQREAIRKEASDWLNSNKVETPKTRLNETEEERKEWERMERDANK